MYDNLVKRLRDAAKMSEARAVLLPHSKGNATAKLHKEAADAIEAMSEYVNTMRKLKCEGWLLHKFHDGCQVVSTMQIPQPAEEVER